MRSRQIPKFPLPLAGLILGQLGLGNLLALYSPYLKWIFGLSAFLLLVGLSLSIFCHLEESKQEFQNPILVSSFAPYPMSVILLSGYAQSIPFLSGLAPVLWWLGFLLDSALIVYFTLRFVLNYQKKYLTPSWTVLYVGIATASLTISVSKVAWLGKGIIWYGLPASLILFPLLIEKFSKQALPTGLEAQVVILAAPLSLLLASSVQLAGETVSYFYLVVLLLLSQFFYFFVLSKIPSIVKKQFHPSWSALTFPVVISALSFRLTLQALNLHSSPLVFLVKVEEAIAVILVLYVSFTYLKFFGKK